MERLLEEISFNASGETEQKVIIEFTKAVLKSVSANFSSNAPVYDSNTKTYIFDSIYCFPAIAYCLLCLY